MDIISFENSVLNDHRLYLCRPNKTIVDEITPHISEFRITENYGNVNQLEISIPYVITTDDGQIIRNHVVDKALGSYLIRYDFKNEIKDYYIITDPENEMGSDGSQQLKIVAYQLQYELKDKLVRAFRGTYVLYDPIGNEGVLNQTLLTKSSWKVGYIDGTLYGKYRTFDIGEQNLLEFVLEAIQTYGTDYVPVFDTKKRELNIYKIESAGADLGLQIEYGNYLKALNEKQNFNEIATRIYAYGNNNLDFRSLNITGMDYIENLTYFMLGYKEDEYGNVISHSPYMSDELVRAERAYQNLLATKQGVFQNHLTQLENLQQQKIQKENELFVLQTELKQILDARDVDIGNGGNGSSYNPQIAAKQAQINAKQQEINAIQNQIDSVENQILQLRQEISIENNFSPELIEERNFFIREKTWQNTYYTDPKDLYDEALKLLNQWSQPTYVYEVDVADILNQLNNPKDKERLKLGSIVTINYPEFNIKIKAKVITIEHDVINNNLKLTIANNTDLQSGFLKYADLVKSTAYSSTQITQNKDNWNLAKGTNTLLMQYMQSAIDANTQAIKGGTNLQYELNERGLTIKSKDDPNKILRAVNSTISISNDGGLTYKNALTSFGLVAETVYGYLIAGTNLVIQNEAGTVQIDGDGMTVSDMNLTVTRSDSKTRIRINATDGIKVQTNTGTAGSPNWQDRLYADTEGNLILTGILQSGSVVGGSITIGSGNNSFRANNLGIWLGHEVFTLAPFSVDMAGNMKASSATLSNSVFNGGQIVGSSINIGNGAFTVSPTGAVFASNLTLNGGSINWNSVNSDPIATNAVNLANMAASLATAIANGSYSGGTFINQRMIYSPTIMTGTAGRYLKLEGSQLLSMNGNTKDGISLDGSTGEIIFYYGGTEAGSIFHFQSGFGPVLGMTHNNLHFYASNRIIMSGLGSPVSISIGGGGSDTIYAYGTWNFSNANTIGLYARFA